MHGDEYRPREERLPWPHAPTHQLSEAGVYFVTSGTYQKAHFFRGKDRLGRLEEMLLRMAKETGWTLEAWAVFSNHYHFVAHSPAQEEGANSLRALLSRLHLETARIVNAMDSATGRRVWYNFRDTHLTFQNSYLARLNYVHQNAVKHGLVRVASHYPYCSAAWFERVARPAQVKTIYGFKWDTVQVFDEYEVEADSWE